MYYTKINYPVNPYQRFFIEKSLELLYKNTLDTNRLRLNNPKTAIQELMSICALMNKKELTNKEYCNALCKEVIKLLSSNTDELIYKEVSKDYYVDLLKNKSDKYNKILQSSRIILNNNSSYHKSLFKEILLLVTSYDLELNYVKLNKLNTLIQYAFIELINLGYSKQYIHKFIFSVFIRKVEGDFISKYKDLTSLIDKQSEKFQVIFGVEKNSFSINDLKKINSSITTIDSKDRKKIRIRTNNKIADYLDEIVQNNSQLFSLTLTALDYYSAVNKAIDILANNFDIYHLGHSDYQFNLVNDVVAIGEYNPKKADIISSNFQSDGYYRSSNELFEEFIKRVNKLNDLEVTEDSKRKIQSAIRYLRLGTETNQLENKLLNYWIGLEYIFTQHIDENSSVNRIRDLFPRCHSLIYLKRNIVEFHKAIKRTNNTGIIENYNDDLQYLKKQSTYTSIINNSNSILLKYRAKEWLILFQNPEKITGILENHQENLRSNLTRLYRIRNEIVHNAAIKNSISTNTSHLRYYLTFILNSILDYFVTTPIDINDDDILNIEDYFISQDVMLGVLENKKSIKMDKFIDVHNPIELLT